MEYVFKKLKDMGRNDVDSLVNWMKKSKVISNGLEAERKAKQLFETAKNLKDVDLDTFKNVISQVATGQHKKVEDLMKSLTNETPMMTDHFQSEIGAFNVALANSKPDSVSLSSSDSDSYSYSFSNSSGSRSNSSASSFDSDSD